MATSDHSPLLPSALLIGDRVAWRHHLGGECIGDVTRVDGSYATIEKQVEEKFVREVLYDADAARLAIRVVRRGGEGT